MEYLPPEWSDFVNAVIHVFLHVVFVDDSVHLEHDIFIMTPPAISRKYDDER